MNTKLLLLVLLVSLISCGKFVQSLYISEVEDTRYNEKKLNSIAFRDGEFTNSFKVAIISDSHDYYSDLAKQVEYINNRKSEIAFVIHTGDATNLGLKSEWEMFASFFTKLKVPYLLAIGNHDLLSNGLDIYKQMFGRDLNFSFVFKQTKFILYNNNNWETEGDAPNLNFLEQELSSSTSTHDVLLAHVQADDPDRYTSSQIDDLKNIVNSHGVSYIINGHNHNYGDGSFGTATRLTAGASVKGKLLILSISDGGISHEFVSF